MPESTAATVIPPPPLPTGTVVRPAKASALRRGGAGVTCAGGAGPAAVGAGPAAAGWVLPVLVHCGGRGRSARVSCEALERPRWGRAGVDVSRGPSTAQGKRPELPGMAGVLSLRWEHTWLVLHRGSWGCLTLASGPRPPAPGRMASLPQFPRLRRQTGSRQRSEFAHFLAAPAVITHHWVCKPLSCRKG